MRKGNKDNTDRILLQMACNDGCAASLAVIYQNYRMSVCDYLRKETTDSEAEDICQAAFVRIHEGKCKYTGGDVASFLNGIARNCAYEYVRSGNIKVSVISESLATFEDELVDQDMRYDPHLCLETQEEVQYLKQIIEELPPKCRQAIEVEYFQAADERKIFWDHESCNSDVFRMRLEYAIGLIKKNFKKHNIL